MTDFELGFLMGRGKFGRVYCARERRSGHIVALKILFKDEMVKYGVERQVLREIEIQSHLKYEFFISISQNQYEFSLIFRTF